MFRCIVPLPIFAATCIRAATLAVPAEYSTIQAALHTASQGDTVLVAPGTYTGSGNRDLDFGGLDLTLVSREGADATIIECEKSGRGVHFDKGESQAARVDGFTIRNGNARIGGGINCHESSPTIANCIIQNGSTTSNGGGITAYKSSLVIANCIIEHNKTDQEGGAIYLGSSNATITGCTFSNNSAGTEGGGIFLHDSRETQISHSSIRGNSATIRAAGIHCYNRSHPTITNCMITDNEGPEQGGGVCCGFNSDPTIANCTFANNTAGSGGGAYCGEESHPTFVNCIFWDNVPNSVERYFSFATLTYCDVEGGYAGEGNFVANPLFVGSGSGDYHLSASSPCIDAGTADGAPTDDYEGDARPQDQAVDVGADEYVALELGLSDYGSTYSPNDDLTFTIEIENTDSKGHGLTRGIFWSMSPEFELTLYDGAEFMIGGGDIFTYPFSLTIPGRAPLGSYTVGVTIYNGDTELSSTSFEFEMD